MKILCILKNLQQFFKISDDEHGSITKQVKKELGMPDDTAVIVVIDDDPSIRKYVDHILKKTYNDRYHRSNCRDSSAGNSKSNAVSYYQRRQFGHWYDERIFISTKKLSPAPYGEGLKSARVRLDEFDGRRFLCAKRQTNGRQGVPCKTIYARIIRSNGKERTCLTDARFIA
jgi:hypothetical protein